MGRKRLRLDLAHYAVPGAIWHITAPTRDRRPLLRDPKMAAAVVDAYRFQCDRASADLLLYCVIPDHVHALIAIHQGDLVSIMRNVNSWTTRIWAQLSGDKHLWQGSFHDHGVRRTEKMDEVVKYILENPQVAGLVGDWRDYPWIGGSLIER
jgi:REP element-mobilizing transposase RayT